MYEREHWLHGVIAPYNFFVDRETNCRDCAHKHVCDRDMEKRCGNFVFGSTEFEGCSSCIHHFKRFDTPDKLRHVDKSTIPCFFCPSFLDIKQVKNLFSELIDDE